ncbi:hypothetical protein IMSAGC008_01934 [Muribaculaceae bacterium]|nr:hypothetical protein IMSAGC008_01934 [Muribaculaceae bacterium]
MLTNRAFFKRMAIVTCFAYTVLLPIDARACEQFTEVNTNTSGDTTATQQRVQENLPVFAADSVTADTVPSRVVEHPKWNFGTNLLEWIGVMPNLKYTTWAANVYGEFYFKNQFSVRITAAYSEHHYSKRKKFQGFTSYIVEPRYWIRKDATFQGFSCGIYGQLGDYNDVDPDRKYTGHFWGAGLSAGYLYPIWKGLAAEFSVRAGYRSTEIKKYVYNSSGDRCLCQRIDQNRFVLSGFALNLSWRF